MMLANSQTCSGCAACVNACRCGALSMHEDEWGELHPVVDRDKCVDCGLCTRACPVLTPPPFRPPLGCEAAWLTDDKKRRTCASGGVGTALAEYVVVRKGGVAFGVAYDQAMTPVTVEAQTPDELERFKGSKYVQSVIGDSVYRAVERYLRCGRWVLFSGTPCQVAGLMAFLGQDHERLVTVDLLCHGVCPTRYFSDELAHLSKKKGWNDISDVRFRGNDGNNYALTIWRQEGKYDRLLYRGELGQDCYLTGFFKGITLRENCYRCPYARPERVSDFTIGDFIGLGEKERFPYKVGNVSSVFVNSGKAQEIYRDMRSFSSALMSVPRKLEERLAYSKSLRVPADRHPLHDRFRTCAFKAGYVVASRKTLRWMMLKELLSARPDEIVWRTRRYVRNRLKML